MYERLQVHRSRRRGGVGVGGGGSRQRRRPRRNGDTYGGDQAGVYEVDPTRPESMLKRTPFVLATPGRRWGQRQAPRARGTRSGN